MKDDEKFQLFLAKLFGDLVIATDNGVTFKAYLWRDHIYVVEFSGEVPDSLAKLLNR